MVQVALPCMVAHRSDRTACRSTPGLPLLCEQYVCGVGQGVSAARAAVLSCAAAPPAPTVVYVAKMLAMPASSLPRGAQRDAGPGGDPVDEVFLAFGRVFAGTLRDGDRVHVLSAAYDPAEPGRQRQEAQVNSIGCRALLPAADDTSVRSSRLLACS